MHRTLLRQLKRTTGIDSDDALAAVIRELQAQPSALSPAAAGFLSGLREMLGRVDAAYEQSDRDIELRTRSLELGSEELVRANDRLREDLASRERALESLRSAARGLALSTGRSRDDSGVGDLESLATAIAGLVRQNAASRRELDSQKFAMDQHAIVSITDTNGIILYANQRFCDLTGYQTAELIGQNHRMINSGLHPVSFFRDMWDTINAGRVWHGEICNRRKDQGLYWVAATIVPFLDEQGVPEQFIAIRTDITAQKELEALTQASERRYRTVVESLRETVFRVSAGGRWTYLNPAWQAITGEAVELMLGRAAAEAVHVDDVPQLRQLFREDLPSSGEEVELRLRTVTGAYRWVSVYVRPDMLSGDERQGTESQADEQRVNGRRGFFGTINDIHDRREALAELREQLHLTRELIDAIPAPIYLKDLDGRYVTLNRAFEPFFGVRREQMVGQTVFDLFGDGEDARFHAAHDAALLQSGGSQTYEATVQAAGRRSRFTIYRKAALTREDGVITGLVGTVIDITERREAESAMLQAKLAAEAANRSKSEFLANMSHEIRTPMNGIIGMTDLVLDTELTAEQREHLQIVKASADSLLTIINDVLDFSKIEAGKLIVESIPFDLWQLTSDLLKPLALRSHEKGIELVSDIAADVPRRLVGDAGRVRQVLVNLVGNAVKFTDQGEVVTAMRVIERQSDALVLQLSVSDTGIGIPEAQQKDIFQAFSQGDSSTTRRFGGTGLGLSICSRLVGLMGGRIWVESEPGKGSTFHFTLRLGIPEEQAETFTPVGLDGKRVLIVDDNSANRRVLSGMLGKWGANTVVCADGESALQALAADPAFDVVLLDAHMPRMDGFGVAERVLAQPAWRGIPMVMLSSGAMRGDAQRCRDLGLAGYFSKPISADELYAALQRVLQTASAAGGVSRGGADIVTRHMLRESGDALSLLLVEDHPVNQKLIASLLQRWGHQLDIAEDGAVGVEKFRSGRYDMILMDMQMPVMDGLEATRRIREIERSEQREPTRIVAMTANAMQGDRELCLQAGMDDYLSKPIKAPELMRYLADLAASRKNKVQ